MPNCFQLTKKGETKPMILARIDDEICVHLGVEPDEVEYHAQWYDAIGFRLTLGKNFDEILADFASDIIKVRNRENPFFGKYFEDPNNVEEYVRLIETRIKIAEYLRENFTSSVWVQIGKF